MAELKMTMRKQKRIAVVNDMTGFGRCSAAVAQPIISAMRIQACVLPTAILSAHTGFPSYFFQDYTAQMQEYIDNWKQLKVSFDGIYTGFLGSMEQIDMVISFIIDFKRDDTKVIVDPVMGDDGRIYTTYTEEMCIGMRRLIACADVITPNLTEVCSLLAMPYPKETPDSAQLLKMARKLTKMGPEKVVITGLKMGDEIGNFVYDRERGYTVISVKKTAKERPGTGDVFASIVAAGTVRGDELTKSVRQAAAFIRKCLLYTDKINTPQQEGICFEEYLTELR